MHQNSPNLGTQIKSGKLNRKITKICSVAPPTNTKNVPVATRKVLDRENKNLLVSLRLIIHTLTLVIHSHPCMLPQRNVQKRGFVHAMRTGKDQKNAACSFNHRHYYYYHCDHYYLRHYHYFIIIIVLRLHTRCIIVHFLSHSHNMALMFFLVIPPSHSFSSPPRHLHNKTLQLLSSSFLLFVQPQSTRKYQIFPQVTQCSTNSNRDSTPTLSRAPHLKDLKLLHQPTLQQRTRGPAQRR